MFTKKFNTIYLVIIIFVLSFIIRYIHVIELSKKSPFFKNPVIDSLNYDRLALQIANGGSWDPEIYYQPPLYPYFMALIYYIFGHDYFILRIIQALIGSASCCLLFLIGKNIFNIRIAFFSAITAALYNILIHFDSELLPPNLFIFLYLSGFLVLFKSKNKKILLLISGIIFGLSAAAVSNILVFIPVTAAYIFIKMYKNRKRSLLNTAVFTVGVLIAVLPFTIRNYIVGKEFYLISSNASVNFYIGNNPNSKDTIRIRPGVKWKKLINLPLENNSAKNFKDTDRFYYKKSIEYILQNPFRWLKDKFVQITKLFDSYEIMRNQDFYFLKRYSDILNIPLFCFGIICPFALTGILAGWNRSIEQKLLILFLIVYSFSIILFFVTSRYRSVLVPVMILFAVYSVEYLVKLFKKKKKKAFIYFILVLLLCILVNFNIFGNRKTYNFASDYALLGEVYFRNKDTGKAEEAYIKALKLDPHEVDCHNDLGVIYMNQGQLDKAAYYIKKSLEYYPEYKLGIKNMAAIYFNKKDYNTALYYALKAEKIIRDDLDKIKLRIAMCYQALRKNNMAEKYFIETINLQPSNITNNNIAANFYISSGQIQKAIELYDHLLKYYPENADIYLQLGLIYYNIKNKKKCLYNLRKVLELNNNHPKKSNIENLIKLIK